MLESLGTDGGVFAPVWLGARVWIGAYVVMKREVTVCGVARRSYITKKSASAGGGIITCGVVEEGLRTSRGVAGTIRVAKERLKTSGGVVVPNGIMEESGRAVSCVIAAG